MKKLITTGLLALTGLALITSSAKAYTYADGDTFLGFYSATKSKDYLLYIGNISKYTTAGGAYTGPLITLNTAPGISIGTPAQINADLTLAFGESTWATDPGVKFGVVSALDFFGANTMFLTDPLATNTTTQWPAQNSNDQQGAVGDVVAAAAAWGSGGPGGSTAIAGKIQTSTSASSYYSYTPAGPEGVSFTYYGNGGIDTTTVNSLAFVELVATDGSANGTPALPDGSKTVLGKFTVASNGTITYAAIAPVPEPSTYAMGIVGAAMLALAVRRQARKA